MIERALTRAYERLGARYPQRALLGEADVPLVERPNVALKGKRESIAFFSPQTVREVGGSVER